MATRTLVIDEGCDLVGERRQINTRLTGTNSREESFRLRLHNRKNHAIHVRVEEILAPYADWKVLRASEKWTKQDDQTIWFDFDLKPDTEKVVTYTVRYDW